MMEYFNGHISVYLSYSCIPLTFWTWFFGLKIFYYLLISLFVVSLKNNPTWFPTTWISMQIAYPITIHKHAAAKMKLNWFVTSFRTIYGSGFHWSDLHRPVSKRAYDIGGMNLSHIGPRIGRLTHIPKMYQKNIYKVKEIQKL